MTMLRSRSGVTLCSPCRRAYRLQSCCYPSGPPVIPAPARAFAFWDYSLLFAGRPSGGQSTTPLRWRSDKRRGSTELFGLARVTERFDRCAAIHEENRRCDSSRRRQRGVSIVGTWYTAYVMLLSTTSREIRSGLDLSRRFVRRGAKSFTGILLSASNVFERLAIYVPVSCPRHAADDSAARPPVGPAKSIRLRLRECGFRYPGSDRWAIATRSVLRPAARVALVGGLVRQNHHYQAEGAALRPDGRKITLDRVDPGVRPRPPGTQSANRPGFRRYDSARREHRRWRNRSVPPISTRQWNPKLHRRGRKFARGLVLPRFAKGYQQMLGRRLMKASISRAENGRKLCPS